MPTPLFPRLPPLVRPILVLPCLILAGLIVAAPVRAQVILDAPGFVKKAPEAGPTAPRGAIAVWPRLDAGALLCRTQGDLDRHFQAMNARLSGQPFSGPNPDCRVVVNTIGIKILAREGPGRTKVQLDNANHEIGWTDTFLPARPPGQG